MYDLYTKEPVMQHFFYSFFLATSGIEPDLTAHEAIVTTFTPYRFEDFTLSVKHNTNKETRTLKGLLPLLLKRRLFTKFQHVR